MRAFIPFIVFLLTAAMVAAEFTTDVALTSPREGQTVTSASRFSFGIGSGEVIDTCSLIVDGAVAKSARYDDTLKGRTLSFAMIPEEGNHTWTVTCSTPKGNITAPAETFTLANPENPVTVKASGTLRGSMVHIFKMENTAEQMPVVVPRVATGDFVEVSLVVPPSTLKKEFYVRSRMMENGTPIAWLTFKQEDYYVKQGENTTLNITPSAKVFATIDRIENNRIVFIFSTTAQPRDMPADNPSETPAENPRETPAENPSETPANDTETERPVNNTETPQTDTTGEENTDDAAPKQGAFKRFLSWLSGIFG